METHSSIIWLREQWLSLTRERSWNNTAPAVLEELLQRYGETRRAYHNTDHIANCLAELNQHAVEAINPGFLAIALWFHDAIYDPCRKDNEAMSANLAAERLSTLGELPVHIDRVRELILDTAHRSAPASNDGRLIVDIDLSILGKPPAVFDNYDAGIRLEYAHVPGPAYRVGRLAVLRGFLSRSAIYQTPPFVRQYEQPARDNLFRAIERLERQE